MTVVLMPRMQTSRAYEFMGSILRVSHLSHNTRTRHKPPSSSSGIGERGAKRRRGKMSLAQNSILQMEKCVCSLKFDV